MFPRMLLLLAVLAAFAAAHWTDALYSFALNVTTKKVCTYDDPTTCIFVAVLNATLDVRNMYTTAVYYDPAYMMWLVAGVVHHYTILLKESTINLTVYTPTGYILASEAVIINDRVPDTVPLCGRNFTAVRVSAGMQKISGSFYYTCGAYFCYEPVRFLNPVDCTVFPLVEHVSMLGNITNSWAYVYILYMPTARHMDIHAFYELFNGTAHTYFTKVRGATPVGTGFYIANRTRIPAIVVVPDTYNVYYGPKAFDMIRDTDLEFYRSAACTAYTIGRTPGDGILAVYPYWAPARLDGKPEAPAEVVYISDNSGGYFKFIGMPDHHVFIYATRYSLADVVFWDGVHIYATRTIACPPYNSTTSQDGVYTILLRAEGSKEIEICSNKTSTAYLALAVHSLTITANFEYYTFIDRLEPGKCRRLRWDGSLRASDTKLYIFPSASAVCLKSPETVKHGGSDYVVGWRYYLMPDNSLVPAGPIEPDELYADIWKEIIRVMAQQYNATMTIIYELINQQDDVLKSILDYLKQLMAWFDYRFSELESALSEWLKAILEMLRKISAPGGPNTSTSSGPLAPVGTIGPTVPAVPVFVPSIRLQLPPYAIGILLLGIFAAAYATVREISLAALITGAAVSVIGIFVNAPIYSAAGIFLMAFGLWNKVRRQSA